MPNKFHKVKCGFLTFFNKGEVYPLFVVHYTRMNIGKIADSPSISKVTPFYSKFVWRQSEFAVFGALTSVGAPFLL